MLNGLQLFLPILWSRQPTVVERRQWRRALIAVERLMWAGRWWHGVVRASGRGGSFVAQSHSCGTAESHIEHRARIKGGDLRSPDDLLR